ncbi:hypothetical protein TYRP_023028 [Tyrophagus putrescentiae]|nr:hypothetical protein TYRP_023028 [Tyrophagus putrescentiae]
MTNGKKTSPLKERDLVAWHSKKLNVKWKGPYKVVEMEWIKMRFVDRNYKEKLVHLNHMNPVVTKNPFNKF